MNAPILFLLTISSAGVAAAPGVPGSGPVSRRSAVLDDPAIRIWLNNNRQYREGERARVEVETRYDGYLLVLNYDTEGRLRVLFPIAPGDDAFVQGGRRYEVTGRGDRESFIATNEGDGLVYAAVSADPFDARDYEAGGNWDHTRLYVDRDSPDAEADITALLERMTSSAGFDYDVLDYRVWGYRGYHPVTAWYPRPYGFYDDFYCDYWYRPSLFGCRYWWPGYSYYPYYAYPRYRFAFGFGYYGGYRGGFGGYWWPYQRGRYFGYPSNYRWPVVVGRPRGYTIVRRTPGTSRTDRFPGSFGGSFGGSRRPGIDYRPRASGDRSRPEARDGRPAVSRPSGDRGASPPAASSRPRGRRVNPDARPNVERRPSGDDRPNMERDRRPSGDRGRPNVDRDRGASPRARPADPDRARRPSAGSTSGVRSLSVPDDRGAANRNADRAVGTRSRPVASRDDGVRIYRAPAYDGGRRASPRTDDGPRTVRAPSRDAGVRVDRAPRNDPPRARASSPERRAPPASAPARASAPRRDPPRASAPPPSRPSGGGGSSRARRPRSP